MLSTTLVEQVVITRIPIQNFLCSWLYILANPVRTTYSTLVYFRLNRVGFPVLNQLVQTGCHVTMYTDYTI